MRRSLACGAACFHLAFARIAAVLHPERAVEAGIHPTATVANSASISPGASIGAYAVIEDEVRIGDRAWIGPGCIRHRGSRVDADTRLVSRVTLYPNTVIGKRCMIGGGVGIAGQLFIADDVVITGYSLVTKSLRTPGSYSSGMAAIESQLWRRAVARLRRLASRDSTARSP